jgi:hypothetical protein
MPRMVVAIWTAPGSIRLSKHDYRNEIRVVNVSQAGSRALVDRYSAGRSVQWAPCAR